MVGRFTVPTILLVASLPPIAMTIVIPGLAVLAQEFGASYFQIQFLVSGFLVGLGLGQLFSGPLSDRFGRRPVLLVGLSLFVLGSLICAMAPVVEVLLAGRLLQALGAATAGAISKALVGDFFRDAQAAKVMSYLTATLEVSMIASAPLGGRLVEHLSWPTLFWFSAGYALFLLFMVAVFLPEGRPANAPDAMPLSRVLKAYRELIVAPVFIGNVLLMSLVAGAGIALFAAFPLAAVDYAGYSPERIGDLLMLNGIALIAGALIAGRVAPLLGLNRTKLLFIFGVTLAAFALPVVVGVLPITGLSLLIPLMLMSLFRTGIASLALPQAIAVIPRFAGTSSGLIGVLSTVLAGIITALGAAFYQQSIHMLAIMVCTCVALAVGQYLLLMTRVRSAGASANA